MIFHPDIVSLEPFVPHEFSYLVEKRAFPENALPEPAYQRMCCEFAEVSDVEVQRITYRHDGLTLNGLIAISKNTQSAGDLILYHRGGSGNYGMLTVRSVLTQMIPLARAGYVVIAANYRGNDGGEGQDEFGGGDVGDSRHLHDIMRSHTLVNDKPCFVIGHSRGCMMTYLLLKQGLKARAAICIAGVAELRNWNVFRSEMREKVYKRFIPNFEQHEEESLTERSAIAWPEKISAPLLLLHGTKDDRVQHAQSEQLAAALDALGKPNELVLYEGGNHALIRHWDDVIARTLFWMRKYA